MLRLLLLCSALICTTFPGFAQNKLLYPPNTVDGLKILEGPDLLKFSTGDVEMTPDGTGVRLKDGALAGSFNLGIQTDFPFNEALPSWNGWAPQDGGFRIWMAVQNSGPPQWFEAGSWGHLGDEIPNRVIQLQNGIYDIDTLLLNQPSQGVQIRIDLVRAKASSPSPTIRLFALSYSNSTGDRRLHSRFGTPTGKNSQGDVDLKVPYYSQVVENKEWIGRICAPASVNMILAANGIKRDTQSMAALVYDRPSDAFGVWNRSIQGGAQYGMRGYLHRIRNWDEVHQMLSQGAILVASIRFEAGEVQDPLVVHGRRQKGTKGHLVVVKGLTADGNVIVHDTASKDHGVNLRWNKEEFAKAWFDKGGVAYIFTGRAKGAR